MFYEAGDSDFHLITTLCFSVYLGNTPSKETLIFAMAEAFIIHRGDVSILDVSIRNKQRYIFLQ